MELCASRAISDLPVFSIILAGNPQLRPKHALPLKMTLPSRTCRSLDFRYRHFAILLPRAAASDDSNGSRPFFTEERDSVATLEGSPSAEKLEYNEIATSEVPNEEPVEDARLVTVEDSPSASSVVLEDSASAEKLASNEIAASEVPKEEPVEGAQEQAFELLNELKLESGDTYSLILYGAGAFVGLWLVSAIVSTVDSIPVFPKLLEVVGLGYTLWFATRFLIFKESRDELAAKIDEVKKEVLGSDDN